MLEYNYIKFLGSGLQGSAHLIEKDGNIYVVKIQKILDIEKDRHKYYDSSHWLEIDILERLQKLDKIDMSHFPRLYDTEIRENCDYKHIIDNHSSLDKETLERIKLLNKSNTCLLYSLEYKGNYVDFNKTTKSEIYSMSAQVLYSITVMNDLGISHNDLHWGNICVYKSKDVYIRINNKKVKLNSNILCSILDFGNADCIYSHKSGEAIDIATDKVKSRFDIAFFIVKGILNTVDLYSISKVLCEIKKDSDIWNHVINYQKDDISELEKDKNFLTYYDIVTMLRLIMELYGSYNNKFVKIYNIYTKHKINSVYSEEDAKYFAKNLFDIDKLLIYLVNRC